MTVPMKIETTLQNLEKQAALNDLYQSALVKRSTGSGNYDHRKKDCRGPKCFLEQYVLDHMPEAIEQEEYEGKPYYTIMWVRAGEDDIIIDLAQRIRKAGLSNRLGTIEAVYQVNDNRDLTDQQFFDRIRELYN